MRSGIEAHMKIDTNSGNSGNAWTGGIAGGSAQTTGCIQPYYPPYTTGNDWWNQGTITVTQSAVPFTCAGNTHVFGCNHMTSCKCGKTSRAELPIVECGHCKKAL